MELVAMIGDRRHWRAMAKAMESFDNQSAPNVAIGVAVDAYLAEALAVPDGWQFNTLLRRTGGLWRCTLTRSIGSDLTPVSFEFMPESASMARNMAALGEMMAEAVKRGDDTRGGLG